MIPSNSGERSYGVGGGGKNHSLRSKIVGSRPMTDWQKRPIFGHRVSVGKKKRNDNKNTRKSDPVRCVALRDCCARRRRRQISPRSYTIDLVVRSDGGGGDSASRGGRGYQKHPMTHRARVSACTGDAVVRVRANRPSTNRNACSGITPPTILGSRHFHLPADAHDTQLRRGRNGFFSGFFDLLLLLYYI